MSLALRPSHNDKFVTALFVAGLAHGILILGVNFDFLPTAGFVGSPSIEVVLVQDPKQSDLSPDEAHYFSEENQSGSGTTTEKVRAESQLSDSNPLSNAGTLEGTVLTPSEAPNENEMSLIVSRSLSDYSVKSLDKNTDETTSEEEARLLEESTDAPQLVSEYDENTNIHSPDLRELFISVNTRKSDLARYLAIWKRKVEQVGTLNFPDRDLLAGLSGNPTLEVVIAADGNLEDVILRKTSGEPRIDQAAMNIVRLSSPFDQFPKDLRGKYDVMRFVYIWQFVDGKQENGSVKLPDPI